MNPSMIGKGIVNLTKKKFMKNVITPLDTMIDDNVNDIVTTIGSFVVRSVRGKFQRSITFTTGSSYYDSWMEEALYGILYQYNNIKGSSRLQLINQKGVTDGSNMYYQLDDGTHNLKYRKWDILLNIQTLSSTSPSGRMNRQKVYTIITFDLDPEFVKCFEKDMVLHRNSLLKIHKDSPTVNVYQDYHEGDGYTYWEKIMLINKRRLDTIYLPDDTKKTIVHTINKFFASKDYYRRHGIAHNLKILLYGPPGPQPMTTPIPTPDGIVPFGSLKIGDYVFDREGNPTRVTEIYQFDKMDIYEVEFGGGRKTRCTYDHLWKVYHHYMNGIEREEVLSLRQIDELMQNDHQFDVPINHPVQFSKKEVSIDPFVMGVFLAKGCFNEQHLTIRNCDEKVANKVASMIEATVEQNKDGSYTFYRDQMTILTDEFFWNDLPDLRNDPMSISYVYLFNDVQTRESLIEGMKYPNWPNIIIPDAIVDQTLMLIHSLGKDAMVSHHDGMSEIAITNYQYASPIVSIKKLEQQDYVMCIKVDNDEHLYQTENFIVTHNTGKDSIAKMIASEWNRNLYYVTGGKGGIFIPQALSDSSDIVTYPLFLVSDIDKYPFLINEPDVDLDKSDAKDEKMRYKMSFANMINSLDGVLSGEDRIIIMTTNHIEKFSETILRPGRIDLKLEIGYVTPEVFRKYVYDYYGQIVTPEVKLKSDKLTIAEMQRDVVFMEMGFDDFMRKYTK